MFINRLDLDNFGPFVDTPLGKFSKQLTVVLGPNEAGKSAIRAFIRNILFGFLNRQNQRQFEFYNYPSIRGGILSGAISVTSSRGESYLIQRGAGSSGGPVTVSGAATGNQALLDSLIGGINKDVYQNVFSISIGELQEFSTLNSGEVRDRIYSSGLGLGAVNLPGIVNELKRESDGLWSPTGRAGHIKGWLDELSTNKIELSKVQEKLDGYENIGQIEQEIAEKVELSRINLEGLRSEESRLDRLVELQKLWPGFEESQRQISDLPDPNQFPIDGVSNYQEFKRKREEGEEALSRGDGEKGRDLKAIADLNVIETFVSRKDDIERLMNDIGVYRNCENDLGDRHDELRIEEKTIDLGIKKLGFKWDRSKLNEEVDLEKTEKILSEKGASLTRLQGELNTLNSEVKMASGKQSDARGRFPQGFDETNETQDVPIETTRDLQSRLDFLEGLQAVLAERQFIEQGVRGINLQLASLVGASRVQIQRWIPLMLILLGAISLIGTAILGEVSGILVGFSMAAIGVGLFFRNRHQIPINNSSDPVEILVQDKQKQLDNSKRVELEIATLLVKLKMEMPPTSREIIEGSSEINKMIQLRTTYDDWQAAKKELREKEIEAAEKCKSVEAVEKEWRDALEALSLDSTLEPIAAATALGEIKTLRLNEVHAGQLRGRIETMETDMIEIESQLTPILEEAGLSLFRPAHATFALESLGENFRQHQNVLASKLNYEGQIKRWDSNRIEILNSLEHVKSEMDRLLTKAKCTDEENFLKKGKGVSDRERLESDLNGLLRAQPLLVNEQGKSYRDELKNTSPELIDARLQQIHSNVEQAKTEHEARISEETTARIERASMENSNPAEELQAKIAELREKIDDAAGKWAVSVIAYEMLIQAREKYQREKQGPLLESASGYFRHFTGGRYIRIESVMGEERLRIIDSFDKMKNAPDMLSRGTAEQLFLAMRFALIDEYAQNSEPMPVVLDDVMVNFDPERAQATCEGIVDLSTRHQVILLTCNPETVKRLQGASNQLGSIEPTIIEL